MKSGNWKVMIAIVVLFLFGMVGTISQRFVSRVEAANPNLQEDAAKGIEGSWRAQVTIQNCDSGAAMRTFPALLSFMQPGVVTETTTGFSPAVRSPGHGFWQHTEGNTYNVVTEAFIFDANGAWTQTQRLTQTLTFGDDAGTWSSDAKIEFFDLEGKVVMSGCAAAVAQRME